MSRKKVYSDPAFAEEMAAIQRQRDEARTAELAEFRRDWAQRLEKADPPVHPSPLHHHEESCWSEPYEAIEAGVRIKVQFCERSRTRREVPQ